MADAQNWEQRVKSELEASKQWSFAGVDSVASPGKRMGLREVACPLFDILNRHRYKDWGSLYAPTQPTNYEERISKLQEKADQIPGVRLQTNNSIYGQGKPFKEFQTTKVKKPELM